MQFSLVFTSWRPGSSSHFHNSSVKKSASAEKSTTISEFRQIMPLWIIFDNKTVNPIAQPPLAWYLSSAFVLWLINVQCDYKRNVTVILCYFGPVALVGEKISFFHSRLKCPYITVSRQHKVDIWIFFKPKHVHQDDHEDQNFEQMLRKLCSLRAYSFSPMPLPQLFFLTKQWIQYCI